MARSDTLPAGLGRRVHRLDLGVVGVQALERADPEQDPVPPGREEAHDGVEQAVEVEGVDVARGRDLPGEGQVPLQERPDVRGPGSSGVMTRSIRTVYRGTTPMRAPIASTIRAPPPPSGGPRPGSLAGCLDPACHRPGTGSGAGPSTWVTSRRARSGVSGSGRHRPAVEGGSRERQGGELGVEVGRQLAGVDAGPDGGDECPAPVGAVAVEERRHLGVVLGRLDQRRDAGGQEEPARAAARCSTRAPIRSRRSRWRDRGGPAR